MKIISFVLLLLHVAALARGFDELEFQKENIQDEIEAERRQYTCGAGNAQGVGYRFCYRKLNTTNSNDIIYFFHGLEGSEETWFTQYLGTLIIQKWWRHWGYRPRIVTISFGPEWLLVNNQRFPLLSLFKRNIMPILEEKMGGIKSGRRNLIGQSMGGFNAALAALKSPGSFSRVALLCPAIATVGPYSSNREIESYIERTGASRKLVDKMLSISRAVFIDQNDWRQHDPLALIQRYSSATKSKFHISVGVADDYGFQEGSEKFHKLAKAELFSSTWQLMPGGHCNFARQAAARFIMGDRL